MKFEIAYKLTEKEYNYLIAVPAMKSKLGARLFAHQPNEYYFIGDIDAHEDMLSRLIYL